MIIDQAQRKKHCRWEAHYERKIGYSTISQALGIKFFAEIGIRKKFNNKKRKQTILHTFFSAKKKTELKSIENKHSERKIATSITSLTKDVDMYGVK